MMQRLAYLAIAAALWPAAAAAQPCREVPRDPEFTQCWRAEYQKSEKAVQDKLRRLVESKRKDEPALAELLTKSQQAWRTWREASCRVETFDSRGGAGFSVYWDQCLIKMNEARSAQ